MNRPNIRSCGPQCSLHILVPAPPAASCAKLSVEVFPTKPCVVVAAALYWVLAVLAPLSGAERRLQETAQDRAPVSAGIRVGETVVFDGIEFVKIPPGEFLMGSTRRHARDDEKPVTRVRISKGFYLGKTEVTQSQWQAVMGDNPSYSKDGGDDCPVESVSWTDVQKFIGKVNSRSVGGAVSVADRGRVGVCGAGGDHHRHLCGECNGAEWQ